ncbi:MAG: alpha/beta fold hydrolase [Candidatus Woesearchaeota archaeon]|jgi:hypothetical protein
MYKRVFLIHGWGGNPNNCWFPWLKEKLESKGFEVIVPNMPDSENPKIKNWVSFLKKQIGVVDKNTYFVGHSIGCQTIMRYLQDTPDKTKVGGVIFVAGFFNLPFLKTKIEKKIAKAWLEIPIDTNKIKSLCKSNNIVAIFSDDDPDVPLTDSKLFKERLNAKIIVKHKKGHFSDDAGVFKLPVVLKELLSM